MTDITYGPWTLRVRPLAEGGFGGIGFRTPSPGKRAGRARPTKTDVLEGPTEAEVISNLKVAVARHDDRYVGLAGAREIFLALFPDGFRDPAYLESERTFKLEASQRLRQSVSMDQLRAAGEGQDDDRVADALRRSFSLPTPLPSTFELGGISRALKDPSARRQWIRAVALMIDEPQRLQDALTMAGDALRPFKADKWTAVTYPPFLLDPDRHAYLKIEKSCDAAARIGDPFYIEYQPGLEASVYEAFMGFAGRLKAELKSLGATDFIDVQSFIWVIGTDSYVEQARGILDRG